MLSLALNQSQLLAEQRRAAQRRARRRVSQYSFEVIEFINIASRGCLV
jgi:hypothetical protein